MAWGACAGRRVRGPRSCRRAGSGGYIGIGTPPGSAERVWAGSHGRCHAGVFLRLPRVVLTHLKAGTATAPGPEPVGIGWWAQPCAVTAVKQLSPSLKTLVPGLRSRLAILAISALRKPLTRRSLMRTGWPSAVVWTAATNGVLPRRAPAALGPGTAAAEVGVVHLHPPGERQFGVALEHGLHQFLLDLPGRGLGDAEPAAEFDGGDPLLRLGHVIDRRKPQGQRQLGRVEERAGGQRDLMTAGGALVELAAGDLAMARGAASGAGEALRPTPAEQGLAALLLGAVHFTETRLAEPLLELNLVAWHCEPPEKPPNIHDLYHINPAEVSA